MIHELDGFTWNDRSMQLLMARNRNNQSWLLSALACQNFVPVPVTDQKEFLSTATKYSVRKASSCLPTPEHLRLV